LGRIQGDGGEASKFRRGIASDETASRTMTEDREKARRLMAFGALWLLVAGLLSALSFFLFAVVATVLLVLVGIAVVALWALRNYGGNAVERVGPASRTAAAKVGGASTTAGAVVVGGSRRARSGLHALRVGQRARDAALGAKRAATAAPGTSRTLADRAAQGYASAVYRSAAAVSKVVPNGDRRRLALRLNEQGAELRRLGNSEQAVEQHQAALAIVRDLGDQQAEAATLNSLGLALAQDGSADEALEHLEQALTMLQSIGDEEHEAQVIANLGLLHLQQGQSQEAEQLLQEALDKLPPESSAYRQVEEQLQRAS
jgi:tetratricopeptide (TPR) repeat protein